MMMTGRYMPGNSILHRMDPRAKLFGFLILIVAVILADSVPGYILPGAIIMVMAGMTGMRLKMAFAAAWRFRWFFVIIFLLNAFFYTSNDPIWSAGILNLSREGVIQGINIALRIILIIIMSSILTMTTKPMGIMTAIEALVRPLKIFRLPAEEMAMILSVAIQFIPTLLEESESIKKAQIARGARFESRKLTERAMALLPMLVPIFLAAFKRADELSVAMEARGYRGAKNRTAKEKVSMRPADKTALILCAAICAAEAGFRYLL